MSGAEDVLKAAVNPFWAASEKATDAGVDAITPDMPELPAADPVKRNGTMPSSDSKAVEQARKRKIAELRSRSGRVSTILSDSSDKLGG